MQTGLEAAMCPLTSRRSSGSSARFGGIPGEQQFTFNYDGGAGMRRRAQGDAMERIRSLGTVVEVCHASNHRICGLKDPSHYPVQQFISNRVPFVVSSDDPGVFDTILADEIDWVVHATGLSRSSFDEITERSWSNLSEVLVSRES